MNNFDEIVENKSNDELLKMVYEFDKWNPEMLASTEAELKRRNLLPADVQLKRQELIELEKANMATGKSASIMGMFVGWLTVFGLLGIFIGYHYSFSKVSNKYTGEQFFRYDETSRNIGLWLFYASIILSSIGLLYILLAEYTI